MNPSFGLFSRLRTMSVLFINYLFWFKEDSRNSKLSHCRQSPLAQLLIDSHTLEKGITMPNRRMGFGTERARKLIQECRNTILEYTDKPIEVQIAIHTLKQYLNIHQNSQYELPSDIVKDITGLISLQKKETKDCYSISSDELFAPTSSFYDFAHSRHSVRWYRDDPVDNTKLFDAIALAQTAPSTCNRQSIKVHIISSPEAKQQVLQLQDGNRGFGPQADKIILLTSSMNYWLPTQRTSAFLDGGIFLLNLLYALHYYHICACTLNAHLKPKQIKKLQKTLKLADSDIPLVFICIGNAPKEMMVAASQRIPTEQIVNWI